MAAVDLALVSLLVSGDISCQIPGDRELEVSSASVTVNTIRSYRMMKANCENFIEVVLNITTYNYNVVVSILATLLHSIIMAFNLENAQKQYSFW